MNTPEKLLLADIARAEDRVRDVAVALQRDARIGAFVVESENFESIHSRSAYALIRRDGRA